MIWYKLYFIFFCYLLTIFINNTFQKHTIQIKQIPIMPSILYCSCKSIIADYHWFKLSTGCYNTNSLHEVVEFVTDLDSHFNTVYRFGITHAIINHNVEQAQHLLMKSLGSEVNQADWRIHWYLSMMKTENNHHAFDYKNISDQRLQLLGVVVPIPDCVRNTMI